MEHFYSKIIFVIIEFRKNNCFQIKKFCYFLKAIWKIALKSFLFFFNPMFLASSCGRKFLFLRKQKLPFLKKGSVFFCVSHNLCYKFIQNLHKIVILKEGQCSGFFFLTAFSVSLSFFFFLSFCLFRAAPAAYGSFQARVLIRAVATGLHHSHSNARSEPCLWPTPQFMATLDPYPTEWGTSWFLVRFASAAPRWELLSLSF